MQSLTARNARPGRLRRLGRNVIALGWVSFFTDVASEMLYPVMPLFLVGTLGASPALLGLIDGIAEGGSSLLRWVAGALSDRFRRRKPFVVAGYTLSALSKPLMGLAAAVGGWPVFLAGRCADRIGKSVRTSARDALIADSSAPEDRGAAFGLHRAMDTAGAVLGPLLSLAALLLWPGLPLGWLFAVALAPGLLSSLLALGVVRDVPHEPGRGEVPKLLQTYPRPFWHLIVANAIFSLGNSSDSFLILRSRELGLTFAQVVLAFALYNAVYALAALPLGRWSDRVGRKPVILCGWLVYAAVYLGFAAARAPAAAWLLLAVYGLYQATVEGVTKAMIGDSVPSERRAGAIGLFYTVSGLGQLAASLLAGGLWGSRWFGSGHAGGRGGLLAPFLIGSVCAAVAAAVLSGARTSRR